MHKVISDFAKKDLANLTCLDIGCSGGIISSFLGNYFHRVIGVDLDQNAIDFAKRNYELKNVEFKVGDAMNLDFPNKHFDVVLCNHVYEHVPDAGLLFDEISRVLKDDGFCYFAAVNKLMLLETHYRVPFLSWFPQRAADLYLKALGKGIHYYENTCTVWGLKKLVRNFEIHDYTIRILRDPKLFFAEDFIPSNLVARSLLPFLAQKIYFLLPTYIWILTKKDKTEYSVVGEEIPICS